MGENIPILYLLGAGRSGTTLVATVLNAHPEICTVGEMHQFMEYLAKEGICSCGEALNSCEFWKKILDDLKWDKDEVNHNYSYSQEKERHRNIGKLLFSRSADEHYLNIHEAVFTSIQRHASKRAFLDSSKYISRYLLLRKSSLLKTKGIFIVRDIRGVIHSFNKQVQTPRKPWSSILYYWAINIYGELVYRLDKNVIKIKYEHFIENPGVELEQIYMHVFDKPQKEVILQEVFEMPHIIGGNRMKKQNKITIRKDLEWKSAIKRYKQILYYIAALPLMIINGYRI